MAIVVHIIEFFQIFQIESFSKFAIGHLLYNVSFKDMPNMLYIFTSFVMKSEVLVAT